MAKFGLAQSVRRVEDPRLLVGNGRYTDDIVLPGMLHGVVLRSPHAAAKINRIDTTAAKSARGVAAIYTAVDMDADRIGPLPCAAPVQNRDGTDMANPPRHALAHGAVRHVGDAVAFIVADTAAAARDAAELIAVDYDIQPSITDLAHAMDAGAAQVWPEAKSNVVFDWGVGDQAATDALFAKAAHVTRLTVVNNRVIVASMEARGAVAEYTAGRWTLHANTQGGWLIKNLIAQSFNAEPAKFRVITPDVGGGFGMKAFLYPEHALVCYAARKLGRPVKWMSDRAEAFVADTQGRDNITLGELAIDKDGKFLALRTRNVANMGAYLSTFAPYIPTLAGGAVLAGVYNFQQIYANVLGVFTHTTPVDAYRGAGRPESNYLLERLVDAAARELNIDRAELRRRNMVLPSAMPHATPVGKTYDSGDFPMVLQSALKAMDYAGFPARRTEAARRGKRRGIGLAYYLEVTMGDPTERAEIRFAADGGVDVYVGTQSTGQGHETGYIQLVSHRLGIDADHIRVRQGDTDTIPTGGGTGGSRSLYSEGQAIITTADTIIDKGKQAAADVLEAAPADIAFADGRFSIVGTDRGIDILALAATQRQKGAPLDTVEVVNVAEHTFPNGCHMAEVEIDPDTGVIDLVRYRVADDFGRTVNPMIVRGQVHGGVAQGLGQALIERTCFDDTSGQLLTGSFMDYALPRAADFPDIEVDLLEVPSVANPLGVKGAGEAGSVGSPPAVMNAILDALAEDGVKHIDMPATPETVWRALHAGR
jgi:aerobic carbon-monoxide dehydrogenase large subunit